MIFYIIAYLLLLWQIPAFAVLLSRLIKGPTRRSPLLPKASNPAKSQTVSVIVPTLNEAARITPCLQGLTAQGEEVKEIMIVDSRSTDQTAEIVNDWATKDQRLQLINDDPLPKDWVGRPWALHHGYLNSSPKTTWLLGMDADTQAKPGLVASLLEVAETENYDLITLSPQFILKYPGELWLQPALLLTLVYRFGPTGTDAHTADQVMANGQCFFCRKSVLQAVNGYTSAKNSFCDDVTLARNIAHQGFRVGFLDGSQLYRVRMYEGFQETWREWGRSLDLKDASTPALIGADLWLLSAVQGLPLLIIFSYCILAISGFSFFRNLMEINPVNLLLWLNLLLIMIRTAMNGAITSAYYFGDAKYQWLFWLSPLADPLAFLRIWLSASHRPQSWRGRVYDY
jgi:dolichol-phosphate mannosyltransferase